MASEGSSFSLNRAAPQAHYRVAVIAAEHRERTKWSIELASVGAVPYDTLDALLDTVEEHHPVVALLSPSYATESGFKQIQRMARSHPTVGAILLLEELSLDLLQLALRAGVRDVATVDAGVDVLCQTVERVAETVLEAARQSTPAVAAPAPETMGRVIVAFSTKGGVGKSMVATNLATGLAMRGKKTVIVDCDLQFGDVAVLLGIPPQHTTVDAAGAIEHADLDLMENLLARHPATDLRVLPAPLEPSAADTISPEAMVHIVELLRQRHEFVIVDMPPHFDDVVLALLDYADDVILVASMDIPSIKNLKVGMQTLDLLSLAGDKLRLVLNRANAKVNLEVDDVERALGMKADFKVPSDICVPQAVNRGIPVILDRPKSNAGTALGVIADHFAGIVPGTASTAEGDGTAAMSKRRWRKD